MGMPGPPASRGLLAVEEPNGSDDDDAYSGQVGDSTQLGAIQIDTNIVRGRIGEGFLPPDDEPLRAEEPHGLEGVGEGLLTELLGRDFEPATPIREGT